MKKQLVLKKVENRKFARKRARMQMEREKVHHKNRQVTFTRTNPITGAAYVENLGSYFSTNWRKAEYGNYPLDLKKLTNEKRKNLENKRMISE